MDNSCVYVIHNCMDYYGGPYDDDNDAFDEVVAIYSSEELARKHIQRWYNTWSGNSSGRGWHGLSEYRGCISDGRAEYENTDEEGRGTTYFCYYEELIVLNELKEL